MNQIILLYRISIASEISPEWDIPLRWDIPPHMKRPLKSLEKDASLLSLWFENNYMKMNEDKSHLLVFGSKSEDVSVNISGSLMQESDERNF